MTLHQECIDTRHASCRAEMVSEAPKGSFVDYDDLEKARCRVKIRWEGGLYDMLSYGIPHRLRYKFEEDFDFMFECEDKYGDKCLWPTKSKGRYNKLKKKVDEYLGSDCIYCKDSRSIFSNCKVCKHNYNEDEMNSVNYIFWEDSMTKEEWLKRELERELKYEEKYRNPEIWKKLNLPLPYYFTEQKPIECKTLKKLFSDPVIDSVEDNQDK